MNPLNLIPTSEEREKIAEWQQGLRKLNAGAIPLPLNRGERFLKYHNDQVGLSEAHLKTLYSEETLDLAAIKTEAKKLCESLIIMGRFDEAEKAAQDETALARIAELREAIDRDDKEVCECPPHQLPTPGKEPDVEIHHRHTRERIYSPKHHRLTPVVRCVKCNHVNVTHHPVAKIEEHRLHKR